MASAPHILGIVVNHNPSRYTELLLRSLDFHHPKRSYLSVTVLDNSSQDELLSKLRHKQEGMR